jgi:AraC-like DNA-binding protein
MDTPELDVGYEHLDIRMRHLRLVRVRSRGVASDWGLLNRASLFAKPGTRTAVSIVLEGTGRFDEARKHEFLPAGALAISSQAHGGTEAYAGARSSVLAIEWEPSVYGAGFSGACAIERLTMAELERVGSWAGKLDGPERELAIDGLLDVLRANGLRLDRADLERERDAGDLQPLQHALSDTLSTLEQSPTIEDVSSTLGWDQRRIHRRMSALRETYGMAWNHWRDLVHQTRMIQAMRLLTARGATTELVARLSGFRSPSALCHAFAKGGLPSPGRLAHAARSDALARLSEFVDEPLAG